MGVLLDDLLLCPVRVLRKYLLHILAIPSHPGSIFDSPRSPSRSLSPNTLRFFIRVIISQASSSSALPLSASFSSLGPCVLPLLLGLTVSLVSLL